MRSTAKQQAASPLTTTQTVPELLQLIEDQEQVIADRNHVIEELTKLLALKEEQLHLAKQKRFDASSVKLPFQGDFFDEAELEQKLSDVEQQLVEAGEAPSSKPPRKKREGFCDKLPRVRVDLTLSDEEKAGASRTFFTKIKEELDIVKAKAQVIEYWQEKAVFEDAEGETIKAAARQPHPLGKCIASVPLLAYILIAKYADALPLYRLEKILARYGGNISHIGCWDHARRKFVEASKAAPSQKKGQKVSMAVVAIGKIRKLYAIEERIKGLDLEQKTEQRQQLAQPVLDDLKHWLQSNSRRVPKDSLTAKAIQYTLNQWDYLIGYVGDGQLQISNALAENAIRPFAVGRRNWLFADTSRGAHASATIYSLIETAKANGLEPYQYLRHVLTHIAAADTVEKFEALLPWNVKTDTLQ